MESQKVIEYRKALCEASAMQVLQYLQRQHPGKLVFSTSMGAEDQIITHMLTAMKPVPDIFTLDTGRLFYETYDLIEKTNSRYKINIRVMFPDREAVEKMVNEKGVNLFYHSVENRQACCAVRKIEPLRRALKAYDVWVTGLRREQSPTRDNLHLVDWDDTHQILKVNPLLEWSESQVWDYIQAHDIPYNPLHDKGYPSLGCKPCTRAIMPGEDIRAGRWWWEQPETKECGLHVKR